MFTMKETAGVVCLLQFTVHLPDVVLKFGRILLLIVAGAIRSIVNPVSPVVEVVVIRV